MKAMLAGFTAMILLAVGAWYGLNELGFSSADRNSGANVRLD
ncbi:hypothetical protein [Mameliella sediminis]|nr:hypothetical protein [Mameliella sediminis]